MRQNLRKCIVLRIAYDTQLRHRITYNLMSTLVVIQHDAFVQYNTYKKQPVPWLGDET